MTSNADNYDHEIVRLLHEHDPQSISLLYKHHYDEVVTKIYSLLLNREDAEDIAQELFTNIWIKKDTLLFSFPLRAYLLTAAANKSLNFLETKVASKPPSTTCQRSPKKLAIIMSTPQTAKICTASFSTRSTSYLPKHASFSSSVKISTCPMQRLQNISNAQ